MAFRVTPVDRTMSLHVASNKKKESSVLFPDPFFRNYIENYDTFDADDKQISIFLDFATFVKLGIGSEFGSRSRIRIGIKTMPTHNTG
jgi:hypothetical protein